MLSPVNATWAANNASYWRGKGFGGFLLTGITESAVSALAADGAAPADAAAAESSLLPLIREVRLARERLSDSGLADNFLYWDFARVNAAFASRAAATSAVETMRVAACLCAAMGLKGIAIDSASSSGFYDYRWDGYAYDDYTPAELESRARRLGRSLARAVLLELPGAEILFITDGWGVSGALWLPLFEGLIEGSAMDEASTICLLTRESFSARSAADLRRVANETRAILDNRFEPEQRERWRRKGCVSLGLSPLSFDAASQRPVAAVDPAGFRNLVAAAKSLSDKYIWIQSAGSSWWQLTQQEVDTYSQLLQNGAAAASQTKPVVENLEAYTLGMPYDDWRRVGPLPGFSVPAEVYVMETGASLVFWAGAAGGITLPVGEITPVIQNLATGEDAGATPESGIVAVPAGDAPLLVTGLPARPWVVEAGLSVELLEAPTPGKPVAKVACRFENAGTVAIRGTIDLLAPADFSVNPASLPFQLAEGDAVEATVNVKGKFKLDSAMTATVSLTVAGGGITTRVLEIQACPDTVWEYALDGDAAGNLVAVDIDGTGPAEVVASTSAGEVVCLKADGGEAWKRRFSTGFTARPAAGLLASGAAAVAVVDNLGCLRLLNGAGEVSWERVLDRSWLPPFFADVDEFAGQELVLPSADGRVTALDPGGNEVWSYRPTLGMQSLEAVETGGGAKNLLLASQKDPIGLLALLEPNGRLRWSAIPENKTVGTAVVLNADKRAVVTATEDGVVAARDVASGELIAQEKVELTGVRFVQWGGPGLLLTSQDGLHAYDLELEPVWSVPGKVAAPPAATGSLVVVPMEGDASEVGLVCLDEQGRQQWRSFRGASVTGSPLLVGFNGDGTRHCVYSSADRTIKCLAF